MVMNIDIGGIGGAGPVIVLDPVPAVPSISGTEGDDVLGVYRTFAKAYTPGTTYSAHHMFGYGGNDRMVGGHGNDKIYGGEGDDKLTGGYGNDTLYGGNGADTVDYGARLAVGYGHYSYGNNIWHPGVGVAVNLEFGTGRAIISGTSETDTLIGIENVVGTYWNDVLQGDEGGNRLDGAEGDDWLFGWGGNDVLLGGGGNDHLTGDDGDDVMYGQNGDDSFLGGNGYDVLIGGLGADSLIGGAGLDRADYAYSASAVSVNLGAGFASAVAGGDFDTLSSIEVVTGSAFDDFILGGALTDYLYGADGADVIEGGGGADYMYGQNGNDLFVGGQGADTMFGDAGIDTVSYRDSAAAVEVFLQGDYGQGGDAQLDLLLNVENAVGTQFNDGLHGSIADNSLEGRVGNDRLFGFEGRDTLDGGAGADLLDGGLGEDTASYEGSNAGINVNLANGVVSGGDALGDTLIGIENLRGSNQADVLRAGLGPVWFFGLDGNDVLFGNAGGDRLYGGKGNDQIVSGAGADLLSGEEGSDALVGGLGNDFLYGGAAADGMTGGSGGDSFVYHLTSDSSATTGRDVIRDFLQGEDIIDLDEVDAISNYALHNEAFTFIGTAAFTGTGVGQLRYQNVGGNTIVQGQTHSQAGIEFEILLTGNFALTANDFIL